MRVALGFLAMNHRPWKVGREINLTRERVRQIQVEGLRRLREILVKQGLNMEALFNVEYDN